MKAIGRNAWRRAYGAERARRYDEFIRIGAGPVYEGMLSAIAEVVDLVFGARPEPEGPGPHPLRLLDLGCGTGNVAERILRARGQTQVTLLDGSADMLAVARRRFGRDARFHFVERDFSREDWAADLGRFDAIASVGAIHHLDGTEKCTLFRQIFHQLSSPGLFLCGDPLRGASPLLERLYEDAWVRMIRGNVLKEQRRSLDLEEIRREHRRLQKAEGDQPGALAEQLGCLSEAGFQEVECYWKSFGFAVFGGLKGAAPR